MLGMRVDTWDWRQHARFVVDLHEWITNLEVNLDPGTGC